MTKKHFIALADAIREHNKASGLAGEMFNVYHLRVLADFCQSMNPNFKAGRWIGYIRGECGPNGGAK